MRRSPVSISIRPRFRRPRATSTSPSSATARRCWGSCCKAIKGRINPDQFAGWRKQLADGEAAKRSAAGANKLQEDGDIHPVRMLEAVRDFMKRDAILCVDGQETLNYRPPDDADLLRRGIV